MLARSTGRGAAHAATSRRRLGTLLAGTAALAGCAAPGMPPAPGAPPTAGAPVVTPTSPPPAPVSPSTAPATTAPAATAYRTSAPTTPPPLVARSRWVTRAGVRALQVTPTDAARDWPGDPGVVWTQLLRVRPDADTPGMRDQLVCHVVFAPGKPAWYLEPARPAVGYAATVAAACNPGDVRDPDLPGSPP